ncbi:MAG: glutamine-hydrolyzing carbamoyl-phosphate synthase small subunit [Candidatus Aenigmarchaeota archaeon]|nr:glutamine-hydrolyzing carbamoyl-phosphate synthase small subunit [Candidatus Aenigmarchaeota archaeon]
MARLVLEDGSVFDGNPFGAPVSRGGEVVFNTGMVGYPESLTDPSYRGQILVLTYPLIGNYGVPGLLEKGGIIENFESEKVQIAGLVVSEYSGQHSHWSAVRSLGEWLVENGIPAISGVDTRMITKKLRERGVMLGKIVAESDGKETGGFEDPNARNLAAEVSTKHEVIYGIGKKRVLLVDCGVKHGIIRNLVQRGATVIRVPWDYDFSEIHFDGIVVSNGPGDPKMCASTISFIWSAMQREVPIFGICLGNQLLALAAGGDTYKLKYGHRSQNQPCIDGEGRCFITSQNHGYAVRMSSLSAEWKEFFTNANDGTNEGIIHKTKPFFSIQFHPEASPGPVDTTFLFDKFMEML